MVVQKQQSSSQTSQEQMTPVAWERALRDYLANKRFPSDLEDIVAERFEMICEYSDYLL